MNETFFTYKLLTQDRTNKLILINYQVFTY